MILQYHMCNTSHAHGKIYFLLLTIVYDGPNRFIIMFLTLHIILMLLTILCDSISLSCKSCEIFQVKTYEFDN